MDCRAHGPFRKLLSTLLSLLAPSACAHVEQDGENRKYLANSTRSFSFVSASGGALVGPRPLDGGGSESAETQAPVVVVEAARSLELAGNVATSAEFVI